MKATVLGTRRLEGTSKKTGRPYAGYVLHICFPSRDPHLNGYEVDKPFVSDEAFTVIPKPNEEINISYGRGGYIEDVTVVTK